VERVRTHRKPPAFRFIPAQGCLAYRNSGLPLMLVRDVSRLRGNNLRSKHAALPNTSLPDLHQMSSLLNDRLSQAGYKSAQLHGKYRPNMVKKLEQIDFCALCCAHGLLELALSTYSKDSPLKFRSLHISGIAIKACYTYFFPKIQVVPILLATFMHAIAL
jgi:hypothetical protein